MIKRVVAAVLIAAVAVIIAPAASGDPAARAESPAPTAPGVPWTGDNAYGFYLGDSVAQQCGEYWGMSWRSLGFVGWPGATTEMMRGRLEGTSPDTAWPAWTVTESSVEEERLWFRDAGWLVFGLGTNDVKTMSPEQFRAQVDWYMEQARGRPSLWFDIVNPPYQAQADAFNAVLDQEAAHHPNLKILDWDAWVRYNPGALLADGVHIATAFGCDEGRNRLIQAGAPDVPGQTAPRGYWYWNPTTSGSFALNGWGVSNDPDPRGPVELNVRVNWQHGWRTPVTNPTGDLWAQTASGHAFSLWLGPEWRGRYFCLDLVDKDERFTSLGCRTG